MDTTQNASPGQSLTSPSLPIGGAPLKDAPSSASAPAAPQNWQIPIALASVFMGVMISIQFRVQTVNHQPNKMSDLLAMYKNLETERNKLQEDLRVSRDRLSEIETNLSKTEGHDKELVQQMVESRIQAGLLPMKGPGITIRLSDSPRKPAADEDTHYFIVHDVDLQTLVNELWAAGAEAVSINDVRIVNRTPIRCVGPTILINAVRLASPYLVRAIGPKDDMDGGLRMPGGFCDSMAMLIRSGGEVRITKNDELLVPAYQGSLSLRFATQTQDAGSKGTP